jgi:ferritin-like protein
MPSAATSLLRGIDAQDVVKTLDGFYCYHLTVMHWAYAVQNRLQGQAAIVLGEELEEVAEDNLKAARSIAARIADLDGAVTADPQQLVLNSPLSAFELPSSFASVEHIASYALDQLATVICAYNAFLERLRGRDDITYALVLKLMSAEVHRDAETRAVLSGD